MIWTPEQLDELIRLIDSGLSRREAAAHFGTTKNAVIGVLDRAAYKAPKQRNAPSPREPVPPLPPNSCCWIDGDPATLDWRWCGQPIRRPGESWCAAHHARVFLRSTAAQDVGALAASEREAV